MAQQFTYFGSRLVQLDRQALFCHTDLLVEAQREVSQRNGNKHHGNFLSLQRVTRVDDLPPGDTYGLQYEVAVSTPPSRCGGDVLVRVMPFLDCRSDRTLHRTHDLLVQENMTRYRADKRNNSNSNEDEDDITNKSKDGTDRVPLRVLWTDCWRVCAAWWGVSTNIIDASGAPLVHAVVQDGDGNKTIAIDARHEHGPNVSQRLALAILRSCSGFTRPSCETPDSHPVQSPTKATVPASDTTTVSASNNGTEQPTSLANALLSTRQKLKSVVPKIRTLGCVDAGRKDEDRFLDSDQWIWEAHARSSLDTRHNWDWIAHRGLSEYCAPQVDDGIVTVPLMAAKIWSRSVVCQYNPNFHYAVVILRDVDDGGAHRHGDGVYVTLENWAVADPSARNGAWGFCVWSLPHRTRRHQRNTFHERLTDSGGYGSVALTFRVRPVMDF